MKSLYSLVEWIAFDEATNYLKELLPEMRVSEKHIRSLLEQGKIFPYIKWDAFVDLRNVFNLVSIPTTRITFYHILIDNYHCEESQTKALAAFVQMVNDLASNSDEKAMLIPSESFDEYLRLDFIQTFGKASDFFNSIGGSNKVLPILTALDDRVFLPVDAHEYDGKLVIHKALPIEARLIFSNMVFKRSEIDNVIYGTKTTTEAHAKPVQSKIFDGISNAQFLESLGLLALMIAETDDGFKKSEGKLNAAAIQGAVQTRANLLFNQQKDDTHKGLSNLNKAISKAIEQINKNIF